MTMLTLGVAEDEREHGVAANCLWPRTLIATAAVQNLLGGDRAMAMSRTPEIVADAAADPARARPARRPPATTYIDDEVLAEAGVTDLARYRAGEGELALDLFVEDWPDAVIGVRQVLSHDTDDGCRPAPRRRAPGPRPAPRVAPVPPVLQHARSVAARAAGPQLPAAGAHDRPPLRVPARPARGPRAGRRDRPDEGDRPLRARARDRVQLLRRADDDRRGPAPFPRPHVGRAPAARAAGARPAGDDREPRARLASSAARRPPASWPRGSS